MVVEKTGEVVLSHLALGLGPRQWWKEREGKGLCWKVRR